MVNEEEKYTESIYNHFFLPMYIVSQKRIYIGLRLAQYVLVRQDTLTFVLYQSFIRLTLIFLLNDNK